MKEVDLAIIGGGGAAFAAAAKAHELGIRAVLLNKGLPLAGTCNNVGCVPSKFLLETGFDYWQAKHPRFQSVEPCEAGLNFSKAISDKQEFVLRNRQNKYIDILSGFKNLQLIEERARFISPGVIEAGKERIQAKQILIATGSSNKLINIPGLDSLDPSDVLDNIKAFELKTLPRSMIVLGGGPTGLEGAQMFHHFGSQITLVEAKERLFSVTEPEVSKALEDFFKKEGIDVWTNSKAKKVRKDGADVVLTIELSSGSERELRAEKLFIAVGVKGNTEDLNLSAVGLESGKNGFLEVDDFLRTKIPGVWAAGDVTGPPLLEPVAAREGALAVENAFRDTKLSINYDAVPYAVFTEPQIAAVGITEEESMRRIGKCRCKSVSLKFLSKADITNQADGIAKMVIDPDTEKIIGFHVFAPCAAEMIHEAGLAIQYGLKIDDIINYVHVFPTYSEIIKITAQAFRRDVEHMSCCVE